MHKTNASSDSYAGTSEYKFDRQLPPLISYKRKSKEKRVAGAGISSGEDATATASFSTSARSDLGENAAADA
ncbi:hypothetical protein KFK09_011178 [Dendrobium nobile]|uniref:Uncharacterized protein n=1 Tax=Dendrobium nobile TaxID=94219 RepID=A0A8T3BDU6_DENNO|nr:hypothetical protein KFK09_011178 [Dendrobium nobile]